MKLCTLSGLASLILPLAIGSCLDARAEKPAGSAQIAEKDQIIGRWKLEREVWEMKPDGTASRSGFSGPSEFGTWKLVSEPGQRPLKFELNWGKGRWVVPVYVSLEPDTIRFHSAAAKRDVIGKRAQQ